MVSVGDYWVNLPVHLLTPPPPSGPVLYGLHDRPLPAPQPPHGPRLLQGRQEAREVRRHDGAPPCAGGGLQHHGPPLPASRQ